MSRRLVISGNLSPERWGDCFRLIVASLKPPLARAITLHISVGFSTDMTDVQPPMRRLRENARQLGLAVGKVVEADAERHG
jgi:hypothetical protein